MSPPATGSAIAQALSMPFEPKQIHWRVGATMPDKSRGIALAYLNARDVMRRLDTVMGFDWQNKYSLSEDGVLVCDIGIRIHGEWIWRANGAGASDIEGEKGKASDAFKRAAVMFGIGRYLYSLPDTWVPLTPKGRTHVIETPPVLPDWATPEGYRAIIAKRSKGS